MSKKYDYDVIIIGAGISGLVCGCYLAKAGLKTLVVEKNVNVGGYCTSFTRKGFRFDACVHFLSTLRKEGKFHKILNNIGLFDKINIYKQDPSDIIISPIHRIKLFKNINWTIDEFCRCFPREKDNIAKFFNYVISTPVIYLAQLRKKTFQNLLDNYFSDDSLKTILATLILGLAGSPSHQISALVAAIILKEFILFDGGYYPVGGMQAFADTLVDILLNFDGKILKRKMAKTIVVKNNRAQGVILKGDKFISSQHVISACDARQTFFDLVGQNFFKKNFIKKIKTFTPSISAFTVYLGIDNAFNLPLELKSSIWLMDSHDNKEIYSRMLKCESMYLGMASPTMKDMLPGEKKQTVCLATSAPFINVEYWKNKKNRQKLENRLISMAERFLPGISKHAILRFNATPATLFNWTRNYAGAAYGWEGKSDQFGNPDISEKTMIGNLYLVGHWNNMGSGVSSVANSGYIAADMIIRKEKRK
ncbi:MAG: NAD(P)/FAD-dependent oxidoreductase [Candidatus Omnitrophota bacterium]